MNRGNTYTGWFRSPSNLVAGALVAGGFLLASIDWAFLALSALGTFGPGILREMGWLNDKDEFEMRASRRAGYHAYLAGGFMVFLLLAAFRSQGQAVEKPTELVEGILVVMWFTWLLSSLLSYWGAAKTVDRILISFGSVWLVFNILAGEGHFMTTLMQSLLALPFFGLAFLARRMPKITGVILIAASCFFFWFFGLFKIIQHPWEMGRIVVIVLFLGPLLTSGITLVRMDQGEQGDML